MISGVQASDCGGLSRGGWVPLAGVALIHSTTYEWTYLQPLGHRSNVTKTNLGIIFYYLQK